MKVGDMIKMITDRHPTGQTGLLIRIGTRHNNRRVGTVLTHCGIETWPLDSHCKIEVINAAR